jgi:HlyD family secretion protein
MNRNRKKLGAGALAAAMLVVIAFLALRPGGEDHGWLSGSGTVEATHTQLGFQAPGRLAEIVVREGDRVAAGAELARLDLEDLAARQAQAEAAVASARAVLAELETGARPQELAQARAARDAARQQLADAERDLARSARLREAGAVSEQDLEKAGLHRDLRASAHAQALEQHRLVEAGPRSERVEAQRAQVRQAEAALRAAQVAMENGVVRAPFPGLVTVRHREPGSVVPLGSPVLTVMDPEDRWVRIYISGDRIGDVAVGARAVITADTDPDREYAGEVTHVASEAEFTPKNVQTREERVRLVYAVRVRIKDDAALDLKPGMPADVRIATQRIEGARSPEVAGGEAQASRREAKRTS